MPAQDPFQPADDDARTLARSLIETSDHAALAVIQPGTTLPSATRVALAVAPDGAPMTLISELASHTAALRANPACALLIGDTAGKGDPLTHPRLTLHGSAAFIARSDPACAGIRAHFLDQRPKSTLYADFPDFSFVRFEITDGLLNAGFGKAYRLTAADL
ncbi:pyridoxamine 5'-phosphate oxidase family protein [Alisedimentitalea sp. MJ-SS2]|uniref:HugZ family pyridoxamine 5'-phosphate oxidase n=1 Tax=Aliisedimentitalea sp. MJ-SS2 TaxID=3049795 RepID=UPI0029085A0D|nr:pyridoxamine 5'-phosphate oxidase family protein [Alisedimentitalea sp. MJ-SS2]MDU8925883.1 pyridoxamine 5'-phosphate oxidase family protein [Alisedimentitalea sp. MJ-SS2]